MEGFTELPSKFDAKVISHNKEGVSLGSQLVRINPTDWPIYSRMMVSILVAVRQSA
jgi:hypothetical protein